MIPSMVSLCLSTEPEGFMIIAPGNEVEKLTILWKVKDVVSRFRWQLFSSSTDLLEMAN